MKKKQNFYKKILFMMLSVLMVIGLSKMEVKAKIKYQTEKLTSQGKTVDLQVPTTWYNNWNYNKNQNGIVTLQSIKETTRLREIIIPKYAYIDGKTYRVMLGDRQMFSSQLHEVNLYIHKIKICDGVFLSNQNYYDGCPFNDLNNCEEVVVGKVDTKYAKSLARMFQLCRAKRLDLTGMDLSNIKDYSELFYGCVVKDLDLSGWKNTSCTNMKQMFYLFCGEKINFKNFKTDNVTNMENMFGHAKVKIIDLSGFNVSNVTNMTEMFSQMGDVNTIILDGWKANKVMSMNQMFYAKPQDKEWPARLKKVVFGNFEAKNCTSVKNMFENCTELETIEAKRIDFGKVTDFSSMFARCKKLKSFNTASLVTSSGKTCHEMFSFCESLKGADLSTWDMSNLETMEFIFSECSSLEWVKLGTHNLPKLTNMSEMFMSCESLKSIDLSGFNTPALKEMRSMVRGCKSLVNINLNGLNTSKVTSINLCFQDCTSLRVLDLSGLDLSALSGITNLPSSLEYIVSPKKTGNEDININTSGVYSFKEVDGKIIHTYEGKSNYIPKKSLEPKVYSVYSDGEHPWMNGNWAVCDKATCKSYERSSRACPLCGFKQYKVSGDKYSDHKYVDSCVAATYKSQGYTLRRCVYCDKTVKYKYTPAKVKTTKIKYKRAYSRRFCIKWNKISGATGYQIQYSCNKRFKGKTTHKIIINKGSTISKTVKKLKGGKKYYIRIRSVKKQKVNGKSVTTYSTWSKPIALKIKK